MNKMALAGGLLALLAACAPATPDRADMLVARLDDEGAAYVMVAAHRAAHDRAPENSLAAIERAIALGADIIEIDVRATSDGVMVVLHDQTVDRTTNGSGNIEQLSWPEVQALRLLEADGQSLSPEHPPSLQAALRTAQGRILVDLDMKTDQVDAVMAVVQALDVEDQLVWFDSDLSVLDRALALDSDTWLMPRVYAYEDIAPVCDRFGTAPVIHIDSGFYTAETVAGVQACGARVWINALGDVDAALSAGQPEPFETLVAGGAGIIQTDHPAQAIAVLERLNRR